MERLPTEAEWKDWWAHPVTASFRRWVESSRQELMELWANGQYTAEDGSEYGTFAKNHAGVGSCSIYTRILGLDYAAFLGAFEESERLPAAGPSGPDQELPSGESLDDHRDA